MATAGARIGVLGATGALGGEVLAALDRSSVRAAAIDAFGTDRSLGQEIEYQGQLYPIETETPELRGVDLLFLCAPPAVSLEVAREALRKQVPAIDLSGAFAAREEVPLVVATWGVDSAGEAPPLLATAGKALPLALLLRPLAEAAGLRRVVGSVLESASAQGRGGIQAIYDESLAIFSQEEIAEPEVFERPVAFDCLPAVGPLGEGGQTEAEVRFHALLARLLGGEPALGLTLVQIPTFVGQGASLAIETERPLSPEEAGALLAKAPGVQLWQEDASGPTTRAASGSDAVLVGRVREDPSHEGGLLLWAASDPLFLAATDAVALAEARLRGV